MTRLCRRGGWGNVCATLGAKSEPNGKGHRNREAEGGAHLFEEYKELNASGAVSEHALVTESTF